jgi:hypothetical protein
MSDRAEPARRASGLRRHPVAGHAFASTTCNVGTADGEQLIIFAEAARDRPTFAKELPKLLAGIWQVFNEYEIVGYVASPSPGSASDSFVTCANRA